MPFITGLPDTKQGMCKKSPGSTDVGDMVSHISWPSAFSVTHSYPWELFPLLSDLSLSLLLTVCAQCGPLSWDTRTWIVQQRVRLIHTCNSVLPSLSLSKS